MSGLTFNDLRSPTWQRVKEHLRAELQRLREENDSFVSAEITCKRVGRIAELKELLALEIEHQPTELGR